MVSLLQGLELDKQWTCIIRHGPGVCLDWAMLMSGPGAGLPEFGAGVDAAIACITEFVQRVDVHRKDFAIRVWRSWVLEDPLVHPYKWLRPDLIPPAPFLSCDPRDTVDGSGVLVKPQVFDEQFRKAWMPFFCRGNEGNADLDAFRGFAEELTPLLGEVQLLPLSGDMLFEVVQSRKPTAGSLDGWGWRKFKALPVAWFDRLASILTLVEEEVFSDGLFDAYIAMIPKMDGDSTSLGQRPLCVLPIALWLWASVGLMHLKRVVWWIGP